MSIKAMKDALITLVFARGSIEDWGGYASEYFQNKHDLKGDISKVDKAITSLRQAIEQAEKQGPHSWYSAEHDEWMTNKTRKEHEALNSYTHKVGGFDLPLYTTSQPQRERVIFPTMLRKMWSGGEVQAWIDENVNKEKNT